MSEDPRGVDGPRGHRTRPVQWRPDRRPTDPCRLAAYDILRAVDTDSAYANLVAQKVLAEAELHGRDAAFTTALAYGTLRRRGFIDAVLACATTSGILSARPRGSAATTVPSSRLPPNPRA